MELIAKINTFVATPNEKSVKIDVSNSKFGRLRDLSESCSARQPALPAGAEATSRVVFLAGTDTADKDGTSKRTTAIAIFGMTKEGGAHDRYGQLPALLDFILSLPKELPGRGWGTTETWSCLCNQRQLGLTLSYLTCLNASIQHCKARRSEKPPRRRYHGLPVRVTPNRG